MIDREMLLGLREQMQMVLDSVGPKYGVVLTVGNCTYADNTATFKVGLVVAGVDAGREEWERCQWKGLPDDAYGKSFQWDGRTYTICGWKQKSPKFPVLARLKDDGKVYKFMVDAVKAELARQGV